MGRSLPWEGGWVRVEPDRSWRWIRCVMCNRPLTDPESQKRGVGPDCLMQHDEDAIAAGRDQARAVDRDAWRGGPMPRPFFDQPIPSALRSTSLEGALRDRTPDEVARWELFQRALRRARSGP